MQADEYQRACRQFDNHNPGDRLTAVALGLCAEAGEVANEFERSMRQGGFLDRHQLRKELGDVAWNLARITDLMGWQLSDIFAENIAKLERRYKERGIPLESAE